MKSEGESIDFFIKECSSNKEIKCELTNYDYNDSSKKGMILMKNT